MTRKTNSNSPARKMVGIDEELFRRVPHFLSWSNDSDSFREIRLKFRPDGTTLAIAKGYAEDGSLVVCFGAGYGIAGALIAVDGTINSGNWREDRPYSPNGKG